MQIKRYYKNFKDTIDAIYNDRLDLDRDDHLGDMIFSLKGSYHFMMNIIVKPTDSTPESDRGDIQQIFCETYLLPGDDLEDALAAKKDTRLINSSVLPKISTITEKQFWSSVFALMKIHIVENEHMFKSVAFLRKMDPMRIVMTKTDSAISDSKDSMKLQLNVVKNPQLDWYLGLGIYKKDRSWIADDVFSVTYRAEYVFPNDNINCDMYATVNIIDYVSLVQNFSKEEVVWIMKLAGYENGYKMHFTEENQLTLNEIFESYWKLYTGTY